MTDTAATLAPQIRDALHAKVHERLGKHFPVRVDVVDAPGDADTVIAWLRVGQVSARLVAPLALITDAPGDPFGPLADELLTSCKRYIRAEHNTAEAAAAFWAAPWYVRVWRAVRGDRG